MENLFFFFEECKYFIDWWVDCKVCDKWYFEIEFELWVDNVGVIWECFMSVVWWKVIFK